MLKMSVMIDSVVLFEQTEIDAVVAGWFHSPERVLDTIDKQGFYCLANYNEKEGMTICYKVVPAYSEKFLPIS